MVDVRRRSNVKGELKALDAWHQEQIEHLKQQVEDRRLTLLAEAELELPEPGTPISLSDAARKYGIRLATLSAWCGPYGWVAVLNEGKRGTRKMVDEHDVAKIVLDHPGRGGPKPKVG